MGSWGVLFGGGWGGGGKGLNVARGREKEVAEQGESLQGKG